MTLSFWKLEAKFWSNISTLPFHVFLSVSMNLTQVDELTIFLSVIGLILLIMSFCFINTGASGRIFFPFQGWIVFYHMYSSNIFCPLLCQWILGLFFFFGYYYGQCYNFLFIFGYLVSFNVSIKTSQNPGCMWPFFFFFFFGWRLLMTASISLGEMGVFRSLIWSWFNFGMVSV